MKIKICGIAHLEDAFMAVEAGADMLGFNFYPRSPRYIDHAACAGIIRRLRGRTTRVTCVGVFVNATEAEILAVLEATGLDMAQLSGDEPVKILRRLGKKAIKAVRPTRNRSALEAAENFARLRRNDPPAFLLDATLKGYYGGTGITADWDQAAALAKLHPLLLAGGLTPENVAEAVRRVQPWGVDVASGVESAPGKKDGSKVRQFIQNVRKYEKETR